jgi:hypothetical protein
LSSFSSGKEARTTGCPKRSSWRSSQALPQATAFGRSTMKEFLRGDLEKYDPRKLRNEVLADDVRILAAWWATGAKDKDLILRLLREILKEIAKRKKKGKMRWTLHIEKVKNPELFLLALHDLPEVRKILEEHVGS